MIDRPALIGMLLAVTLVACAWLVMILLRAWLKQEMWMRLIEGEDELTVREWIDEIRRMTCKRK